jgi:peptidoglycan/LPS O-acetylase OafA/YrhL
MPNTTPLYPKLANPRYRSLDMWRGLACICVVMFHASVWASAGASIATHARHPIAARLIECVSRLQLGVPMFFVISGYCIAATSDSSRRKTRGVTLDFFKRRLRRIYPPYWAMLSATLALCFVIVWAGHPHLLTMPRDAIPPPTSLSTGQWIGNLTLTETWRAHVIGLQKNMVFSPAWTLCYEEQFYIVCGLLLLAPRRFFTGIAVVTALTVLTLSASILFRRVDISGFFFDGYWLSFAAGVAVYYCLNYPRPRGKPALAISFALAIFMIAVVRYVFLRHSDNSKVRFELYNLLLAGFFALAILLLRPLDDRLSSAPILRPLMFCGRMCYSLYLIHWPIVIILGHILYSSGVHGDLLVLTITIPAVTALSLLAAAAFYHLIERHFLNSTPPPAPRPQPNLLNPILCVD